ncbi:MAG: hypothetical protein FWG87_04125 [Defluviitaleaceae bacterium]|nr:hypothetical protein [Defluviitaleaceae bacterium]
MIENLGNVTAVEYKFYPCKLKVVERGFVRIYADFADSFVGKSAIHALKNTPERIRRIRENPLNPCFNEPFPRPYFCCASRPLCLCASV